MDQREYLAMHYAMEMDGVGIYQIDLKRINNIFMLKFMLCHRVAR